MIDDLFPPTLSMQWQLDLRASADHLYVIMVSHILSGRNRVVTTRAEDSLGDGKQAIESKKTPRIPGY
jgi:hypothetical protein